MIKFEAGKTYYGRSICDHNMISKITVAKRTVSTIVTSTGKRLRVKDYNGCEYVLPDGNYSMALRIRAESICTDSAADAA